MKDNIFLQYMTDEDGHSDFIIIILVFLLLLLSLLLFICIIFNAIYDNKSENFCKKNGYDYFDDSKERCVRVVNSFIESRNIESCKINGKNDVCFVGERS